MTSANAAACRSRHDLSVQHTQIIALTSGILRSLQNWRTPITAAFSEAAI
jgi:hypothetical protein